MGELSGGWASGIVENASRSTQIQNNLISGQAAPYNIIGKISKYAGTPAIKDNYWLGQPPHPNQMQYGQAISLAQSWDWRDNSKDFDPNTPFSLKAHCKAHILDTKLDESSEAIKVLPQDLKEYLQE